VGLVDRLFGRAGAPAQTTATPPASIVGQAVPWLDAKSAVGLSAVWRCVTLIADTISDMPWQEWRGDTLLEASRLVRRPYALMTRREWTWRVVATEALYNTVHLMHVGGMDTEGAPWSLLPLPPAVVQPGLADPWGLMPPTQYLVAGQNVEAEYMSVIRRAPFPGVTDQMSGLLDLARRQFTAYVAADTHMSRYWQAGGPTTTVITTDQELDDGQAEKIGTRWVNRRAMGADYPAVLGKGAKAEPWGADPTTESAVEARREINADVGRYFGMPTRILNAPAGDSETYSNVENDALDLLRLTLRGYMGPVEDTISQLLPGDYIAGRRMAMDPSRFLSGDLAGRTTAYVALVDAGIVTRDEARTRGFGLPPLAAPTQATPAVTVTPVQEVAPA
jgi:HK97 family phage portal protein